MTKRKASIEALQKRCDVDLAKIESEYADSLHRRSVQADLQVDIKNLCENLRSVLDYVAHDVRETVRMPIQRRASTFRFLKARRPSMLRLKSGIPVWIPNLPRSGRT